MNYFRLYVIFDININIQYIKNMYKLTNISFIFFIILNANCSNSTKLDDPISNDKKEKTSTNKTLLYNNKKVGNRAKSRINNKSFKPLNIHKHKKKDSRLNHINSNLKNHSYSKNTKANNQKNSKVKTLRNQYHELNKKSKRKFNSYKNSRKRNLNLETTNKKDYNLINSYNNRVHEGRYSNYFDEKKDKTNNELDPIVRYNKDIKRQMIEIEDQINKMLSQKHNIYRGMNIKKDIQNLESKKTLELERLILKYKNKKIIPKYSGKYESDSIIKLLKEENSNFLNNYKMTTKFYNEKINEIKNLETRILHIDNEIIHLNNKLNYLRKIRMN